MFLFRFDFILAQTKLARRPTMRYSRSPDVERHAIHWVENLSPYQRWLLLQLLTRLCPKHRGSIPELKRYALYANVLIPIVENGGSIPQDAEFQGVLQAMDLNAWIISRRLHQLYQRLSKAA